MEKGCICVGQVFGTDLQHNVEGSVEGCASTRMWKVVGVRCEPTAIILSLAAVAGLECIPIHGKCHVGWGPVERKGVVPLCAEDSRGLLCIASICLKYSRLAVLHTFKVTQYTAQAKAGAEST